ncbi:class Ib ribonucleoside-diphosphate reductase assembly flavoprotein NrdI [Aerococcus sp. 1KP-2016]|jgi:protein involved in ribonucleotide reduction|uniref:class Ib ribonucleoside-diphosphate reductase assembly flavoprotein NrdI n=1 Tax=Aerococcus sp. 1KP-2016 TaxID=1981982 RepID=UPI000B9806A2|nr:class Ib ribonucleoside-diphosphate reductase assembly flavoprotein NrdI [Aerococcus sp. 1KP-2016]OYQ67373.1 class Ib ribonucleoside-diphosphate reductase assembly flavoprotein NrdI [Aerococcus sp. 1KP-2016]
MACIVYYSLTGQTRKFVNKVTGFDKYEISSDKEAIEMSEPFIMVIPSYESHVYGDVIETAEEFLECGDNAQLCKGFFGGGNRNFAQLFCVTVKELSALFDVPVLHGFEFQGSPLDVAKLTKELEEIDQYEKVKH